MWNLLLLRSAKLLVDVTAFTLPILWKLIKFAFWLFIGMLILVTILLLF